MKSTVYFASLSGKEGDEEIKEKLGTLLDTAGYEKTFTCDEKVLVKLHFGEKGNLGYIRPKYVKTVVDKIKHKQGKPFLSDTSTLYRGERSDAQKHLMMANEHGFNIQTMGCPIIMADGLLGQNQVAVDIPGTHFNKVHIASDAVCTDSIFGLAHVTGHLVTGMGGGLKNIGMGLAGRGGKLAQHYNEMPIVNPDICSACGTCADWCPEDAITVGETAVIDSGTCIGCGECISVCPEDALEFEWKEGRKVQERVAEYASGVLKDKKQKAFFINFITHVTRNCDCLAREEKTIIPDIGIAASHDIVALDTACAEIIKQKTGDDPFIKAWPEIDYTIQLKHAQSLDVGSMDFEIKEV
ncbi:DUF362 domain-containing protein [Fibrobacterota bacterium]